jgi:NDT80 / PhoG like DNA-binding  family
MEKGFFLSGLDWTCYRRNYFQISASFSVSGLSDDPDSRYAIELDGMSHPVAHFMIGIASRVAHGEKTIELVQHTPKRDKGPQMIPQLKHLQPGGNPHQYGGTNSTENIVTFERLQFKSATANNGKRRAAQQYYCVIVDLYVQTESGIIVRIASTESAPLVVRGRSPGHYTDIPGENELTSPYSPASATPFSATYASPFSALPFTSEFDETKRFGVEMDDKRGQWLRSRYPSSQSVSSFITADSFNSFGSEPEFRSFRDGMQTPGMQTPLTPNNWQQYRPNLGSPMGAMDSGMPSMESNSMQANGNMNSRNSMGSNSMQGSNQMQGSSQGSNSIQGQNIHSESIQSNGNMQGQNSNMQGQSPMNSMNGNSIQSNLQSLSTLNTDLPMHQGMQSPVMQMQSGYWSSNPLLETALPSPAVHSATAGTPELTRFLGGMQFDDFEIEKFEKFDKKGFEFGFTGIQTQAPKGEDSVC